MSKSASPLARNRLRDLPLSDGAFVSACMTADVPRGDLTLVIVRIIVAAAGGGGSEIDAAQCRSAAFLFNGREDVARLVSTAASVAGNNRALLHTRMPGATGSVMLPIVGQQQQQQPARSVLEEMTLPNGRLRGAVHVSGALRAWQRQCPPPQQPVCVRQAVAVLQQQAAAATTRYRGPAEKTIIASLQKLTGNGRPTKTVPADCECTTKDDCDCFLRRAMYRAGNTWLILYAVLPPPAAPAGPVASPGSPIPGWLQRLLDGTASESEAGGGGESVPFARTSPVTTWTDDEGMPFAVVQAWYGSGGEDECSESSCDATVSNDGAAAAPAPAAMVLAGPLQMCIDCVLARQPRSLTLAVLTEASRLCGPYYGPLLKRVLGTANTRNWSATLRLAARFADAALGNSADELYWLFRPYAAASAAIISVTMRIIKPTPGHSLAECERMGYVAAVVALALHYIDERAAAGDGGTVAAASIDPPSVPARRVNRWPDYMFSPQ